MKIKFNDFAKIIFMAESANLFKGFLEHEASLKAMYIQFMEEMTDDERSGFIQARSESVLEWKKEIDEMVNKLTGDK